MNDSTKMRFTVITAGGMAMMGCAMLGGSAVGDLVSDTGEVQYLTDHYGKVTRSMAYIEQAADMTDVMRLHKERVLADSTLSTEQKEAMMAEAKDFQFEENRYIAYFFRMHEPALVHQSEFHFTMTGPDGKDIVEKTLPTNNKVTVTMNGDSLTSYNYVWMLKLKKAFTRDNFPEGKYDMKVTAPDGKQADYQFKL